MTRKTSPAKNARKPRHGVVMPAPSMSDPAARRARIQELVEQVQLERLTGVPEERRASMLANQAGFLAAYAETGVITQAAKLCGIERRNHHRWMAEDPEYPLLFAAAHEEACDAIEAEMRRRAIAGVEKPVFHQGIPCGIVIEYSDTLLAMLANGALPEKYKQRTRIEGEIVRRDVTREALKRLTDSELEVYEALAAKVAGETKD